jgi:hypothetical protein
MACQKPSGIASLTDGHTSAQHASHRRAPSDHRQGIIGKVRMTVPNPGLGLTDHFRDDLDDDGSNDYYETQVRNEFIAGLFVALDRDIDNAQRYAEACNDAIRTDAAKLTGAHVPRARRIRQRQNHRID